MVALQEMNLARFYPIIFWNTANLIVDSGGIQKIETDEDGTVSIIVEAAPDEDEEEELEEWEEENEVITGEKEDKRKEKNKSVDYGKVASAIGKFATYGIRVSPPNINNSSYTFTPIVKDNKILYGLRGITRLSASTIQEIIKQRPFTSLDDFLTRVKINKVQMVNLIKCGAFDTLENRPREEIMASYIDKITDKKQRLTLQNMQMLINKKLIPKEMAFYEKLFLFNKFLKTCKNGNDYQLNDAASNFITNNFNADLIDNGVSISQALWDNIYQKGIDPMRQYLKAHKEEMLTALNEVLYKEMTDKYAAGNISRWEMESVSFYSHEHELAQAQSRYDNFFNLPEEPEIDYIFSDKTTGKEIKVYRMRYIIGTVIDKQKLKNTVTLLTPTGVVNVKIYKNQYAIYDKQLSQIGDDGKKHVIEYSWFKRGTLLMIQGIRRGHDFIPKKRRDSFYPIISKITQVDGALLQFQTERMEVD